MRHRAIPLLVSGLALALAACEPMPPQPPFTPVIAPIGTGVGLPPARPTTVPAAGVFNPDPISGPPIIEESLTDVPGDLITRPVDAPLDPSIAAAVDAAGTPPETTGPVNTLPLGEPIPDVTLGEPIPGPVPASPFPEGNSPFPEAPVGTTPLPDPPLATVPGGPLPDIEYRGSRIGAESPGYDDARATPQPVQPGVASTAAALRPLAADYAQPSGISDEQSFDAVQRRTIEDDAQRLALLRATRQEVAPEPVPVRPGEVGPNVVSYAVAAPNAVGQRLYRRSGLRAMTRVGDACARFASATRAQEAFLAAGGPARDRHGLTPMATASPADGTRPRSAAR